MEQTKEMPANIANQKSKENQIPYLIRMINVRSECGKTNYITYDQMFDETIEKLKELGYSVFKDGRRSEISW